VTASVLVTDADQRACLAVVRSLGRAGYQVHVCSSRRRPLAAASRFCRSSTTIPDALLEPDRFVESLADVSKATSAEVVLPVTDPSVIAVLSRKSAFGAAAIPFPTLESYRDSADKVSILERARSVGFAVPCQTLVTQPDKPVDVSGLRFPVVVKPHRSVALGMKHSIRHAEDPRALERVLSELPLGAFPVLVQERIVGPGVGLFLLLWDDRLQACFAHRRLLEKPPSGGVSVRCESAQPDPGLLSRAESLLRALKWQGVAMVECKMDSRDGKAYLMEVNGRFWGSLQLAIDAGVDFPVMLVRLALGHSVDPVTAWRPGTRLRWSLGEVDHLLTRMRHSGPALALPPDIPGVGSVMSRFLTAPFTGFRGEVLRWDDPAPAVREAVNWLRRR
jgi:predicted ATP-grasp superfamily ATP-dependent carboligase